MSDGGYYDPHPTRALARPVVLTGFFGAGLDRIGRAAAATSGVGFSSLPRWIEHRVGCSIATLVARRGSDALDLLEREGLDTLLGARPPGLIALGEWSLLATTEPRLEREAHLVYCRWTLAAACERINAALDRDEGCYAPWIVRDPQATCGPLSRLSPAQLENPYAARLPGYTRAKTVLTVAGGAAVTWSQALWEALDRGIARGTHAVEGTSGSS